jgi:hypothetical protein
MNYMNKKCISCRLLLGSLHGMRLLGRKMEGNNIKLDIREVCDEDVK